MPTSIIAHRYAQAFIKMAQAKGIIDEVAADLNSLTLIYNTNKKLVEFLTYPERSPMEKSRVLENIIKGKVEPLTLRFLELLINKNRIEYLPEITENYGVLKDSLIGVVRAKVRTTFPLNEITQSKLREKLSILTGKTVILNIEIDRLLLGGLAVQIGDTVFDGSVKQQLNSLHEHLLSLVRLGI